MLQNQATMPLPNIIWLILPPKKNTQGLITHHDNTFDANRRIGIGSHHVIILHSVASRKSVPSTALVSTIK